jgi:hypothetical protein
MPIAETESNSWACRETFYKYPETYEPAWHMANLIWELKIPYRTVLPFSVHGSNPVKVIGLSTSVPERVVFPPPPPNSFTFEFNINSMWILMMWKRWPMQAMVHSAQQSLWHASNPSAGQGTVRVLGCSKAQYSAHKEPPLASTHRQRS